MEKKGQERPGAGVWLGPSERASVMARLQQLHQEYNQLSTYLSNHTLSAAEAEMERCVEGANEDMLKIEIKNLSTQVQVLTDENSSLEKKLQDERNENVKVVSKLKQELYRLKEDTGLLKDILKRLNEQLNRYHLKHGKLPEEETPPNNKQITSSSIYKFSALLKAYDETILERDATIRNSTEKMEQLMVKVNEITTENEKLHIRIEKLTQEGPVGREEAALIAADARLVLEERQLLLQEVAVLRQQHQQEAAQHQAQVRSLEEELEGTEARQQNMASQVAALTAEREELQRKCRGLDAQLQGSVSKHEHQLAIDECEKLFEELRRAYSQESGKLRGRVKATKREKHSLAQRLTDSSSQAHTLSLLLSSLKVSARKSETRLQRRERLLRAHQSTARLAQSRLKSLATVCSELLDDRERLLGDLLTQRKELEDLSREVEVRSAAVGSLTHRLKEERISWRSRMAEAEGALKAARSAWKRANREALHLKSLNVAKDETIASLMAEYKLQGLSQPEAKHHHHCQHFSKHSKSSGSVVNV